MIIQIITIILLVALSAFFSASETAFSSLNRNRIKTMSEQGDHLAGLIMYLSDNYDQLLTTILIGNNIVNLAAASFATAIAVQYFDSMGVALCTGGLTLIILIFGEITPKSLAHQFPEKMAFVSAPLLWLLFQPIRPISYIFNHWKTFLLTHFHADDNTPKISQEELLNFVDEVKNESDLDQNEINLLKNAIRFNECQAKDIFIHRVDMVALPADASYQEAKAKFIASRFSRIPVFEGSLDNIIGIARLSDLFQAKPDENWKIQSICTPPFFVQNTEDIDDILKKLQKNQTQMAIVLDPFGGTLGIITVEDILEELVGEIWNEHDEVVEHFKTIAPKTTSVDCAVSLDEFNEHYNQDLEASFGFLGEWILEQLQKVPQKGDTFTYNNLKFTVSACRHHRIMRVEVVELN